MRRPIKIIFDPQIFCAQMYGGVSRYFCELAPRISETNTNYLVKIIAPMYVNEYLRLVPKCFVRGFPVSQFIYKNAFVFASYLKRISRLIGIFLGTIYINLANPNVIHQTYYYPIYLIGRRTKKVLTIHDMIHEKFPSDFPLKDNTARYKRLATMTADHVICVSESTRRDVIDILGVAPTKISVVYLGFNCFEPLQVVPSDIRHFFERPYLLYVGQRAGYKNFSKFLLAYVKSRSLKEAFNIVCFGGGSFTANEVKSMNSLGVDQGTVLQIAGDDQLLGHFYKNASALVYPSLYEGFGIPPLEAMSQGCPVVCSMSSSIPEVVGNAGEYFDPNNVLDISNAIERVVFSKNRAEELQFLGRQQLSKFSWDKCAKETAEIYTKLVESSC